MKEDIYISALQEFKHWILVISYERIFPYIQRIVNGEDSSPNTNQPITETLCR